MHAHRKTLSRDRLDSYHGLLAMLRSRRAGAACRFLTGFLLVAGAVSEGVAAGEAPRLASRPGGVVRWPGDGISACGRGDSTWKPRQGACWFPIDLLQRQGALPVFRLRGGKRETAVVDVTGYPYDVQYITLKDDSKVSLSAEDLTRVRSDQSRVGRLWSGRAGEVAYLPLAPPLEELSEGGRFGARRFFNDQPRSPHSGADFAATAGTAVLSAGAGRVVLADDLFFSGKSVFIDHGDRMISMYFHLSEITVEEGQAVARAQRIGSVGATGRATGPHLHFGVRWHGARVDPALVLGDPGQVPAISTAPDGS